MNGRRLLLVSLVLIGCHRAEVRSAGDVGPERGDSIALERTLCFGFCPAYRVTVTRSGLIHFVSLNPQDSGRVADARVAVNEVDRLFAEAVALRLDTVPPKLPDCRRLASDHPTAILIWYRSGGDVRITDYLGCHEYAPAGADMLRRLRALESAVDTVANVSRWVTRPNRG
jgi:hypothetical protein